MKFFTSGGCIFLALFCGYGFLASGEYSGTRELWWKVGYGSVGVLLLLTALWLDDGGDTRFAAKPITT